MTSYRVQVKNQSGSNRSYFLWVEQPQVTPNTKVYQNVYMTAPNTSSNGSANFTCHADYYAVAGTSPGQKLGNKVQVTTSDYEMVKLNQSGRKGSSFKMTCQGDGVNFDKSSTGQNCDKSGAFMIECSNLDNQKVNPFIGFGMQDPTNQSNIVPVATIPAQSGTQTYIHPKTKYYVGYGNYQQGEIVDMNSVQEYATVDFTGKTGSQAMVNHNEDGTFKVTFN